jgi:predicted P-loop ATPase
MMIELMQGAWILELPELTGFQRADVRAIKAFISRQKDRARLAYARRAGEFPRQCIFIGSTNDREYLKDDTGGRRFWPMPCHVAEIDTDRLERERRPAVGRGRRDLYRDARGSRAARCRFI